MVYLIISRKCPEMQRELAGALRGRRGITVTLDRRYGDRRAEPRRTVAQAQRADRRRVLNLIPSD